MCLQFRSSRIKQQLKLSFIFCVSFITSKFLLVPSKFLFLAWLSFLVKICLFRGKTVKSFVCDRMEICLFQVSSICVFIFITFFSGSDGKESACNAGDLGSISGSGRSPEEGNGYPLQYSCLENPMDKGPWWATVHGV